MTNLRKWRKWILGAALLIACVESVALWQWKSRPKYLRYVSQPLKDGTRYTFLYPARLAASAQPAKSGASASFVPMLNAMNPVYMYEPGLDVGGTEISVQISESNSCEHGPDETKNFYFHHVYLCDSRSRYQFFLQHTNCAREEQPFYRDDKVLSDSFKILPPGAPIPS